MMAFDHEWVPRPSPSCAWNRVGDETLIVSAEQGTVTAVNRTAGEVWNLCDGRTTLHEIVMQLQQSYAPASEQIDSDVKRLLAQMLDLRLLAPRA